MNKIVGFPNTHCNSKYSAITADPAADPPLGSRAWRLLRAMPSHRDLADHRRPDFPCPPDLLLWRRLEIARRAVERANREGRA